MGQSPNNLASQKIEPIKPWDNVEENKEEVTIKKVETKKSSIAKYQFERPSLKGENSLVGDNLSDIQLKSIISSPDNVKKIRVQAPEGKSHNRINSQFDNESSFVDISKIGNINEMEVQSLKESKKSDNLEKSNGYIFQESKK